MMYLGIDIGKNNHVASLIGDSGKDTIFKGFSFSNTTEGANSLILKINEHLSDFEQLSIGMEATGHYWLSIYSFLSQKCPNIHVINPIQTDGWRKGAEIRKRKTDKIDSVLIAEQIRYGDFREMKMSGENLLSLKTLTRFRSYLVDSAGDLKRKVICVLDQIFPEYSQVFSDIFGKTSTELLLEFATPAEFEAIGADKLSKIMSELSRQRISRDKAELLSKLAANSFGLTFCLDSFSFQLKMLIEQIRFIEKQTAEVEKEIKILMKKIDSPITSIPGVGNITGAVILSEFGGIERFGKPEKLVAFAGLDASVSQSGNSISQNNKMSKRGSPYLRRALYQSALIAATGRNPDPVLSAFYLKKRAEGKHHKTCVGAVARKLCYIIFAILTENRPFESRA